MLYSEIITVQKSADLGGEVSKQKLVQKLAIDGGL